MRLAFVLALACALSGWLAKSALAQQLEVSCGVSRDQCFADMARECPAGSLVLEEKVGSAGPAFGPVYHLWYRCAPLPGVASGVTAVPGTTVLAAQPSGELAALEERRLALKQQRSEVRMAGPVATMIVGYGLALGGFLLGASLVDSPEMDSYSATKNNTGYALIGVAAGGLALGIFGHVRMVQRRRVRRGYMLEMKALEQERRDLRYRLHYGVAPSAHGGHAVVRMSF